MYTCVLNDLGLTYSNKTFDKLINSLNDYITEEYGECSIKDLSNNDYYNSCLDIKTEGTYVIFTKNKEIVCEIHRKD